MKYSKWIGFLACIILIIACFLPWTYHAALNKTFTGFFSEQNNYGKPGKFLVSFGILSILLIWLDKFWAKRFHLFLSALFVGYAIKTYTLFVSCHNSLFSLTLIFGNIATKSIMIVEHNIRYIPNFFSGQ